MVRWAIVAAVALAALAAVSLGFALRGSKTPSTQMQMPASDSAAARWGAGAKRAPEFRLRDEHGTPISLASLRGRTVLLTFIDPLCRDFCPVEAQRLSAAIRESTGEKPTIVAVSVNTAGNRADILQLDERKWNVAPEWRWAVGDETALARVWRAYHIEVIATTKTVAGVHVRNVAHTEASYLIDGKGYERALFVWPYTADAVSRELRAAAA